MTQGAITKDFLSKLDLRTRNAILDNIAKHYDISHDEVLDEITHPEAENLLDYVTFPVRPAARLMMQKYLLGRMD